MSLNRCIEGPAPDQTDASFDPVAGKLPDLSRALLKLRRSTRKFAGPNHTRGAHTASARHRPSNRQLLQLAAQFMELIRLAQDRKLARDIHRSGAIAGR